MRLWLARGSYRRAQRSGLGTGMRMGYIQGAAVGMEGERVNCISCLCQQLEFADSRLRLPLRFCAGAVCAVNRMLNLYDVAHRKRTVRPSTRKSV